MASPAGRGLSTLRVITVELVRAVPRERRERLDRSGGASCAGGCEEPAIARRITVGRCTGAVLRAVHRDSLIGGRERCTALTSTNVDDHQPIKR